MSSISDVSSKLGTYMLRGWVLTDRTCPNAGCNVPLMRSPASRTPVVQFCVSCDGDPDAPPVRTPAQVTAVRQSSDIRPPSLSSIDASTHYSRSSTPPTEISSGLSSPTFAPPPIDPEELQRRRQQSDRASAEIGKLLLQGWAMLADECPNSQCHGIPLMRPPKAGGGKDPRKLCVACETTYVDEKDSDGFDRLVPASQPGEVNLGEPGPSSDGMGPSSPATARDKGKSIALDETPMPTKRPLSSPTGAPQLSVPFKHPRLVGPFGAPHASTSIHALTPSPALESTARSLETTLQVLSDKLTTLSSVRSLDLQSISQTAETISKVTEALGQVKQLESKFFHSF
ncbi:hypothetical protein JAAARDRAFT_52781 [Jaapia argillacea MUCL 33604]|uniref:Sjogrens syndrome scleroderma autoantigen 1 family protein n=1 Tax=Jaapia argillacea MUCL 33604 TaxID=933084 RepID=A0A067QQA9_9AGAM|nr:hypothetical protein JAAARDRAFT_52781 [Jaapia argillacea MUCL 33604]